MVIGDPFKFSIQIDPVKEWCDYGEYYKPLNGGVMIITVDGFMFPDNEVLNIWLEGEVRELIKNLKKIPVNKEIFGLKGKEAAFIEIYNRVHYLHDHPDDFGKVVDEFWWYRISPMEILDKDYHVYAISDGENVRILASKLRYIKKYSTHKLNNITVREAYVTCNDIEIMVKELNDWLQYYNQPEV